MSEAWRCSEQSPPFRTVRATGEAAAPLTPAKDAIRLAAAEDARREMLDDLLDALGLPKGARSVSSQEVWDWALGVADARTNALGAVQSWITSYEGALSVKPWLRNRIEEAIDPIPVQQWRRGER